MPAIWQRTIDHRTSSIVANRRTALRSRRTATARLTAPQSRLADPLHPRAAAMISIITRAGGRIIGFG
jgi:hypothetical protein